jgi:M6 family metalloprotease-like protein
MKYSYVTWFSAALLTTFAFSSAFAVPANPDPVSIKQPDGSSFILKLKGDEFFSWNETSDGYAVAKDAGDGYWKYAKPASGEAKFEIIPGAKVGAVPPSSLGIIKNALPEKAALRKRMEAEHSKRNSVTSGEPATLTSNAKNLSSDISSESRGIPSSGVTTVRNIVILAAFSDHWSSSSKTVLSTKGRVTTEYSNLFNQIGYTTDGAVGSVRDYYTEVSYGKLTIETVVTPWVVLPHNEAYYGGNTSSGDDSNPRQMVTDAISAANTAGFDFSQGDSDGDGWVDCLTIIHSGYGEEYTGNSANCIWSHQWDMESVSDVDGVSMSRYHTEPALRGLATSSTSITRIGVVCHEMGHFFGLPDLYDYSYTTLGLGSYCIMANGSWNGSDGKRPAHFSAYPKYMLGFVKPKEIHSISSLSIPRVEDNAVVHLYRDGMSNNEYFLVENRTNTGFDSDSKITPGIYIYHVCAESSDNDLSSWTHPLVKIEEADGDDSLGSLSSTYESGDIWTASNGFSGGFRDQTGCQSSNAMMYQSSLAYNRADSSSSYSYIRLNSFSAAGNPMTYTVSTLKPTMSSQTATSGSYTVSWGACTNATKYELQEGSAITLTSFSDGAESEDDQYENWYAAGTIQRDSSGAKSGSYCYAMNLYYDSKSGSNVQSLTMKNPFTLTTSTSISFYYLSCLATGSGYLKCQISNDGGDSWETLGTYVGHVTSWTQKTFSYSTIQVLGLAAGESCLLRFVGDFEYGSGWSEFPGFGFAIDDISITGTQLASYGNWATLNNAITTNSHLVTGKSTGEYAYRARAYSNSIWQGYGSTGVTTVDNPSCTVQFETDGTTNASLTGTLIQTVNSGEDCTAVMAVAPTGCHFSKWTRGGVDYSTSNPLTVKNVTESMTLVAVFAINTFKVTFSTDGTTGASLTGTLTQTVNYGDGCSTVTANVPAGYHFVNWTESGADYSTDNPLTVTNVTEALVLTAVYAIDQYTVNFQTDGTTDASLSGTVSQTVEYGTDCTAVTAVPPSGRHFLKWTKDGSDYSTDNPITVVAPTESMTLIAVFVENQITVVFQTDGTANASLTGTLSQTVDYGGDCASIMANAPVGGDFVKWTKDGEDYSASNPLTVSDVTCSMTFTAVFAMRQYDVVFQTDGTTGASLTGTLSQIVVYGSNCSSVTANAPTGYHFIHWAKGGVEYSTSAEIAPEAITESMTLIAVFAINQYSVTFETDGTINASLTGELSQNVNYGGDCTSVTANAPTGYHFAKWTKNDLEYSVNNPLTVTDISESMTFVAVFSVGSYTLTYAAGAGGSISGETTQTVEHGGNAIEVVATPDTGYHFVRWSDGVLVASRTDENVISSINATAYFEINTYTMTYSAGLHGTIEGEKNQVVAFNGSGTEVTAVPDEGYHFIQWSDGVLSASRTDSEVKQALELTATFARSVGTIVVQTTPDDAPWSFTDPDAGTHQGEGYTTLSNIPTGDITITWESLDGYNSPATTTLTLEQDGAITFTGVYGPKFTFSTQPEDRKVYVGDSAEFSVSGVGGFGALSYKWWFKDSSSSSTNPLAGSSSTMTLSSVQLSQMGTYWCEVTDEMPVKCVSLSAKLLVYSHLQLLKDPVGGDVYTGSSFEFTVQTEGGLGELSYQWYKDGVKIDGAVGSTYLVSNLVNIDSGYYSVIVMDEGGDVVESDPAILEVGAGLPVWSYWTRLLLVMTLSLAGYTVLRGRGKWSKKRLS